MNLSPHHQAVWAVLKRRKWLTSVQITDAANALIRQWRRKDVKTMLLTTCSARTRDFRKQRYGGHNVRRLDRSHGLAPVYRLIK